MTDTNAQCPFRPEDIIYQFTLPDEQREAYGVRIEEYALIRYHNTASGFVVWYKIGGRWRFGYVVEYRMIIAQLLADLTALKSERDTYKGALETYAAGNASATLAIVVLEAGEKLRGTPNDK